MSCNYRYDSDKQIVYITQEGQVSLDERIKLIDDIAQLDLASSVCFLSDIRKLTTFVTGEQSRQFLDYLNKLGLKHRKAAIVHNQDFPAYTLVTSDAVLNNYAVEEFTSFKEAEDWLLSG